MTRTQEAPLSPSTGVAALDDALGGLFWGDNVVWALDEGASIDPFYTAVIPTRDTYEFAGFVALEGDPDEVAALYPGFDVLDGRPTGPLGRPGPLLTEIRRRCRQASDDLLLFDSLGAMAHAWGEEKALRFFSRACPMLLEVGAVAYWWFRPSDHLRSTRKEIEEITQCVVAVGEDRLRVVKAEARSPGIEGGVYRYRVTDGAPELTVAPAAARLGSALRALRATRGLNQSDLARFARVSPSAISQAERGQRGLSLETLLELTGRLNITLDELLRGEIAQGYRLGRRHGPRERADGHPLALLDDPAAGLRVYVLHLPPGGTAAPPQPHKGAELVAVARGLVQVTLAGGRSVLRTGETLLAERTAVTGWRNLGEGEAMLFWILRDDLGAITEA